MVVRLESPCRLSADLDASLVQKLKSDGGCAHAWISCRESGICTVVFDGNDRLAHKRRRCRDTGYGDWHSTQIELNKCGRGRDRKIRRQRRKTAIERTGAIGAGLRRLEYLRLAPGELECVPNGLPILVHKR